MTKSTKDHSNIEDTKGDLQNQYVRMKGCFDSTPVSHMLNPNLFLFKCHISDTQSIEQTSCIMLNFSNKI